MMTTSRVVCRALVLCLSVGQVPFSSAATQGAKPAQAKSTKKLSAAEIDGLIAPVALYPDQLLTQMFLAAPTPARVADLDKWLKTKPPFTGSELQGAAEKNGFEAPLVMLVLFPQVVDFMTVNLDWTTQVGQVFTSDRAGVLASVHRLRIDAIKTGKLKTTKEQSVSLKEVEGGQQVIVIEPTNPQVVYVPQYSVQTVYSQPPTSTVVVVKEDHDDSAAMAAGLIGFTTGIVIGAAINNSYYYGPYGWHGSPYMYGGGWDDYYDNREDAREDYYEHREDRREDYADHREDMADSRSDRANNAQEQRADRSSTTQQQRTDRQQTRQQSGASASSYEARGQNRDRSSTATERSGTKSDAFSGYSSGKSERSASARGQRSRSSGGRTGGGRRK